jgi:DNA-binding HxlR family transcriptional regulator
VEGHPLSVDEQEILGERRRAYRVLLEAVSTEPALHGDRPVSSIRELYGGKFNLATRLRYDEGVRQTSFAEFHCSLAQSLEVMGDWWTPLIIRDVAMGLNRFDEIVEDLGISRNLLATRLEDLERNGIVERKQYQARPPRFEYTLAKPGEELLPVLMALTAWGDRWFPPPAGKPLRLQHRACGHSFTPVVCCSVCSAPVAARSVTIRPGPGSVSAPGTRLVPERLRQLGRAARRRTQAEALPQ